MFYKTKRNNLSVSIRRAEPDDVEAQVRALRQLQKYPTFMVRKSVSQNKVGKLKSLIAGIRMPYIFLAVIRKWMNIVLLFVRRKQLG